MSGSTSSSTPGAGGTFQPLLDMATPQVFGQVAFRLLEVPVFAGERELERRRELMEKAVRSGLAVAPGPGRLLPPAEPPDEHALRSAAHALQDAQTRLAHEFFWFWPLPPNAAAADPALRHVAAGDAAAALALWRRADKDARPAARHNLAVWHLLHAVEGELGRLAGPGTAADVADALFTHWRAALGHFREIGEDQALWRQLAGRIRAIDDASLPVGAADRLRDTLPVALTLIMARLAMRAMDAGRNEQAGQISGHIASGGLPAQAVDAALRIAVEPARALCRTLRQEAQDGSAADGKRGDTLAEQLLDRSARPLAVLQLLLPAGHPALQAERDETADVALTCANRHANATGSSRRALALIDRLAPLAVGSAVRDRVAYNRNISVGNLQGSLCWFCGQNDRDESCDVEVPMYGDVQTQAIEGGTRTTWRHGVFKVPRCRQCVDEDALVGLSGGMAFLALNGGLFAAGALFVTVSGAAGIALGVASMAGAIWLAVRDRRRRALQCRPEVARRPRDEFPDIKELRSQGWVFGERPAG